MKTGSLLKAGLVIIFLAVFSAGHSDPAPEKLNEVNGIIKKLESSLEEACQLADQGKLTEPKKYQIHPASENFPEISLTITKENFNQDLEKGLALLDRYTKERQTLVPVKENKKGKKKRTLTPEEAMRSSEQKTASRDQSPAVENIQVVNIFEDYESEIKNKQAQADKMAEADMMRVNEERRMAEAEIKAKEEAERKIQEQNRQWQNELDAQAEKAAQEALAWKRKYGAGAFFKNIFRTAVSGTVSSLTGGLASSIGAGYADIVIRRKFPEFKPSGKFDKDTNNK